MRTRNFPVMRRIAGVRVLGAVLAFVVPAAVLSWGTSASASTSTIQSTQVFAASAPNAAGIQGVVDVYRAALGEPNNGANPPAPNGRREINWDAVPDQFAAPNLLPNNFFNVNSPRGAIFFTPGRGVQVSATAASGVPVRFGNLNRQYPGIFGTFSPERLFTAIGSRVTVVQFRVPGTNTAATVNGFGAVFTDVDKASVTAIDYFDAQGNRLIRQYVPPGTAPSRSRSFLGVKTPGSGIFQVRIYSGNAAPSATNRDGGAKDVVVMDDFIYGEPDALR
jgi:hypothetical protein